MPTTKNLIEKRLIAHSIAQLEVIIENRSSVMVDYQYSIQRARHWKSRRVETQQL